MHQATKSAIGLSILLLSFPLSAGLGAESDGSRVATVEAELRARFPGAKIEISAPVSWSGEQAPAGEGKLVWLSDLPQGKARFRFNDGAEGTVGFSAWIRARVATRRVVPGERLKSEDFVVQTVDEATGRAREARGLILSEEADLDRLEAVHTILQGQFVVASAVRKLPDVRKGEPVRIRLVTGDVVLTAPGVADEPGYLDAQVRVMSSKSKRMMIGRLRTDSIVEVRL